MVKDYKRSFANEKYKQGTNGIYVSSGAGGWWKHPNTCRDSFYNAMHLLPLLLPTKKTNIKYT